MIILLEGDECHEVKIKPCDGKGCAGWIWCCNLKVDIFKSHWQWRLSKDLYMVGVEPRESGRRAVRQRVQVGQIFRWLGMFEGQEPREHWAKWARRGEGADGSGPWEPLQNLTLSWVRAKPPKNLEWKSAVGWQAFQCGRSLCCAEKGL